MNSGNLITSLIDMAELAVLRRLAEQSRACIHCGEAWGEHSNIGANCPNRSGKGPLYLSESFE